MVIRRKRRPLNPRRRKNKSTILRMHFQTNRNLLFNAHIKNTTHLLIFKGSEHEQINVGAKNGDLSLFDRAKILISKLHKINFRFNSIRFSTKIRNIPTETVLQNILHAWYIWLHQLQKSEWVVLHKKADHNLAKVIDRNDLPIIWLRWFHISSPKKNVRLCLYQTIKFVKRQYNHPPIWFSVSASSPLNTTWKFCLFYVLKKISMSECF